MLPLPKFIKPWKDAGEANALFAPSVFIDEHVFLTKTGAIGVVFELSGIDPQCLTDATMDSNTKRLAAAFELAKTLTTPASVFRRWRPPHSCAMVAKPAATDGGFIGKNDVLPDRH